MDTKQIGVGLVVLAIIGVAAWQFGNSSNKANTNSGRTQMEQSTTSSGMMEESAYQDGEYVATGNYTSPAQEEEVEITITLEDGVVTDAEFNGKATHETSMKMQGLFAEGYEEEVVGKPIDEISLDVVNGSSLTPQGFMDALEKVKQEAQA